MLQVGASRAVDAVLAAGSLEETVSVEAAVPLVDVRSVDVRSSGLSAVVDVLNAGTSSVVEKNI